jgi:hypothetical protein
MALVRRNWMQCPWTLCSLTKGTQANTWLEC